MKFPSLSLNPLIVLLAVMTLGSGCSNAQSNGKDEQGVAQAEVATVAIQTSAVCGTCKKTLETAMKSTEGVSFSKLDLGNKVLTVEYDPALTNPDAIRKAVSETGYDADDVPMMQEAHDNLPACCQKDSGMH
jgi:periplasmic mercuric ion binding protein